MGVFLINLMTELQTELLVQNGEEPFGLRPGELVGPTSEVLTQLLFEIPQERQDDFWLFRQTALLGEGLGVDEEDRATALGLVRELYLVDPEFARSSMEALPLALGTADVLEEAGVTVDKSLVWLGVIHDVGKKYVDAETRNRSNQGAADYGPKDHATMEPHVIYGWLRANFKGLHRASILPAGHHLFQPDNSYGMDVDPTPAEETALLCVANGDSESAIMTRNNNRSIMDEDWEVRMAKRRAKHRDVLAYMLARSSEPIMNQSPDELAELILERTWHPKRPEEDTEAHGLLPQPTKIARGVLVLAGRA